MKPLSELLVGTGTLVLVTTHNLIDDASGISCIVDRVGSHKKVFALSPAQPYYGEMARSSVVWAKTIGHAGEVLLISHELAVLLGAEAGRGKLVNGIVIVQDGKIVWSAMVDARRPNTPHTTLTAFGEAFDRYNR